MINEEFASELLPQSNEQEDIYLSRIKKRVVELIDEDVDLLFSFLYRLDVEEQIIQNIIKVNSSDQLPDALAKAIWDRQKLRIEAKRSIKIPKIKEEGWEF
ncbi:MAG: hypothetical protein ABI851_10240 [Saprospiraceae bacterium]